MQQKQCASQSSIKITLICGGVWNPRGWNDEYLGDGGSGGSGGGGGGVVANQCPAEGNAMQEETLTIP